MNKYIIDIIFGILFVVAIALLVNKDFKNLYYKNDHCWNIEEQKMKCPE